MKKLKRLGKSKKPKVIIATVESPLPNNGMQRTRNEQVFYRQRFVRAADPWRYADGS